VSPGEPRTPCLHGELEAVDSQGHRVLLAFDGARIVVRFVGLRAALAAVRSARALRVTGLQRLVASLAPLAASGAEAFAVEFVLGSRRIGRAGREATPNWLGRALGAPHIEVHCLALLGALFGARS
jgi:hypothetical protein